MVCPKVVHFIGPQKPWKARDGQFHPRFAAGFRDSLSRHGWAVTIPTQSGPMADPASMRRMLIKHLIGLSPTARYLAKFPDDLTLLDHGGA
jgi:hypothetical protein